MILNIVYYSVHTIPYEGEYYSEIQFDSVEVNSLEELDKAMNNKGYAREGYDNPEIVMNTNEVLEYKRKTGGTDYFIDVYKRETISLEGFLTRPEL